MKTYSLIFNSVTSSFSSVTPAKAGAQLTKSTELSVSWIPAFAGMTDYGVDDLISNSASNP